MRPSLLLAEDDAELRDLYSVFFTEHGYDTAVAENGLDCLRQLRRARPDLLVLDFGLTWGGGDGVLDWLRRERASFELPVIVTATTGYPACSADVPTWPVVEFLAKPFPLTRLAESIDAAIARERLHWNRERNSL